MKTKVLLLIVLIAVAFSVDAQTVTGTVSDSRTGETIVGATIVDVATQQGVITDIDGRYSLQVQKFPATISVRYVGYKELSLTVRQGESGDVILEEDLGNIEEVVVVGYGTQKRTQLTGSVSTVRGEVFDRTTSTTIGGALGGQVAGLAVTATSGQPGAASSVRIRGGNSVNASNDPLYVIDGFIYYKDASAGNTGIGAMENSIDPLASINPSDIESIEVLKDVSATAIYGSRGANGVILVTTKKGSRQKNNINYRYTLGLDQATKRLDLLNAREWARLQKDKFYNKGNYTDEEIDQLGDGTDWQDAILRNAFRQSHELSIAGGDQKSRHSYSANYTTQDGVLINSNFTRYNFHVNLDREVLENVVVGVNSSFGRSNQKGLTTSQEVVYNSSPFSDGITNSFVYALMMPPVVPIYNEDGSYNYGNPYEYAYFAVGNKAANPVSDLENSVSESINDYLLANVYAKYQWRDLVAKAAFGLSREQLEQNYFSPSYTSLGLSVDGVGGIGNKHSNIWQQEYTIEWSREVGNHEINALGGYTYQTTALNYSTVLGNHFTNEDLKQNNLADASNIYPPSTGLSQSKLHSIIARVNYTYNRRYNATATFRADHSSRFAANNRWGYFPSIGLSWNIDQEDFLRNISAISALKLRASLGTVGNQEIGDYEFSQSYQANKYNGSASYVKTNNTNSDLKWETTASYNVGLDAGLLRGKLNIVADVYFKKTNDLLLDVPTGGTFSGTTSQLKNVGNVENKGVELSASYTIINRNSTEWTISANIAHNHNEITSTGGANDIIQGSANQMIIRQGESLGSFYGYIFDGVDSDNNYIYRDTDHSGTINYKDRVILGSIQPKLTYGFSSSFKWKNLDASLILQGSHGNKVYNGLARRLEQANDAYNVSANYYTAPKTTSVVDSRYIQDAGYLKLNNITIGYTFVLKAWKLSARTFVAGSNILTFSNYGGYDPEVASGNDLGAYPASRSIVVGFEIKY